MEKASLIRQFKLPASIMLNDATALRQEWLALAPQKGERLTLDASAVEAIGAPGLQLLEALWRTVQPEGSLCIEKSSEAFLESCRLLGFAPRLPVWSAHHG